MFAKHESTASAVLFYLYPENHSLGEWFSGYKKTVQLSCTVF